MTDGKASKRTLRAILTKASKNVYLMNVNEKIGPESRLSDIYATAWSMEDERPRNIT
jgi:hypothetical protein